MDYLTVVTAAGKAYFVANDSRRGKQIVKSEKIVTSTGSQFQQNKRQQLFLSLAGSVAK
jgi:hypothetical protein